LTYEFAHSLTQSILKTPCSGLGAHWDECVMDDDDKTRKRKKRFIDFYQWWIRRV